MNRPQDQSFRISYEGVKRRDDILRLAKHVAQGRRRRRKLILNSAVYTLFISISLMTAYVAMKVPIRPSNSPEIAQIAKPADSTAPNTPKVDEKITEVTYDRIETDPTLLDRLSIKPEAPVWRSINDDELFRTLVDAGIHGGIVELDGTPILLTN